MEKISVIIPVYNGEKYLDRCIKSLLNQTYENIEFLFVNDGSTDSTLNVLKTYQKKDNRIIIIDKENTGVSDSRNIGIDKAQGDYICFCDADDMYENNYIETMLSLIKKNKADVVRCNFKVVDSYGHFIEQGNVPNKNKLYFKRDIANEIMPNCLNGSIPCFTYLLMIKKDKLKVRFPIDVAMMEDVVFYIKLLMSIDNIYITNNILYTIMFNENGATNNAMNYKRNINNVVLANKYIRQILNENNLLTAENMAKLNINHLNAIADFIFKHYLYSKNTIEMCKDIRTDSLLSLIKDTDLSQVGVVRRIIFLLLKDRHYLLLRIYFVLRKVIFNFKRRKA